MSHAENKLKNSIFDNITITSYVLGLLGPQCMINFSFFGHFHTKIRFFWCLLKINVPKYSL